MVDIRCSERAGPTTQRRLAPSLEEGNREDASDAHIYANPSAPVESVPPPAPFNSARQSTSPVPIPSTSGHTTGSDYGDVDNRDQAVNDEYEVESRHGLGLRMDGRSGRRRRRESMTQTTYFTHTDAGVVRVVELPPSYHDLQFQPAVAVVNGFATTIVLKFCHVLVHVSARCWSLSPCG